MTADMQNDRPPHSAEGEQQPDAARAKPDQVDGAGAPPEIGIDTEPGAADWREEAVVPRDEHDALNERFLRLAAEFDNYRKRTERERAESWNRAQADLVKKVLEPIDDLERVADFTEGNTSVRALLEGVQMVERKLLRALETAGLEVIDARGKPFDPEVHEALMTAPAEAPSEDGLVGEVFQKGYAFKSMLLRPARVQVRKLDA